MENFSIFDVLPLPLLKIHIVDVGARFTEEERYIDLMERGVAHLTGIDQDESQLPTLKQRYPDHIFFPAFIADGTERTFYRCHYEGCSSLFRPDPEIINQFVSMATSEGSNFEVISEERVQTRMLDDIDEIKACDYLKVDVQGAELDVLRGATITLKDCLVAEIEIEFVPVYKNQPLFGDVDNFMRRQGYFLHRFINIAGRAFRPFSVPGNPVKPVSQFLWADAVYVKKFTSFDLLEPQALLNLAVLMYEVYNSVDLCALALAHYDQQMNTSLQSIFFKAISEMGVELSFINVKDWTD